MAHHFALLVLAVCCLQQITAQTQYFQIGGGGSSGRDYGSAERVTYVQRPRYIQRPARVEYVRSYRPAPRPVSYRPAPQPVPYQSQPAYRQRDSGEYASGYSQPAQYQFAYRVRASGKGYGGYGDDGGDRGYGGNSAEFGHSESRNGDNTKGRYFVELPDGRLQTVDYYVDGYSGYVARVSYSGGQAYGDGYGQGGSGGARGAGGSNSDEN